MSYSETVLRGGGSHTAPPAGICSCDTMQICYASEMQLALSLTHSDRLAKCLLDQLNSK